MIIHGATINTRSFEAETGWTINSEGACKADTCIPLPFDHDGQTLPAKALAEAMHLPFVEAPELDIMAIGPESLGSHSLQTARAPDLSLPDLNGNIHRLSEFLGQKVILYAWAPY
ncbi:MAG: peroxiredoxin family protein [Pseudomonadales bacterium]